MKLKTLILTLLPLIATAENWKYVIVDADAPMPWEDLETAAFTTTNWYTNASSSAFLKRDGSLPMMGDFDAGGYDGDNFGSVTTTNTETETLTISGGSPTNGAVWMATNTDGGGEWQEFSAITVVTVGQAIPNASTYFIVYNTTPSSKVGSGLTAVTNGVRVDVAGTYLVSAGLNINSVTTGSSLSRFILVNTIGYHEYIKASANSAIYLSIPPVLTTVTTTGTVFQTSIYAENIPATGTNNAGRGWITVQQMR
jgi:hypothetical protein